MQKLVVKISYIKLLVFIKIKNYQGLQLAFLSSMKEVLFSKRLFSTILKNELKCPLSVHWEYLSISTSLFSNFFKTCDLYTLKTKGLQRKFKWAYISPDGQVFCRFKFCCTLVRVYLHTLNFYLQGKQTHWVIQCQTQQNRP